MTKTVKIERGRGDECKVFTFRKFYTIHKECMKGLSLGKRRKEVGRDETLLTGGVW